MTGFDRLLAKKNDPSRPEASLLPRHLDDAHRAAGIILATTAAQQLAAFGLSNEIFGNRFERLVLAAAVLHDLGKANDHFQTMIGQFAPSPQRVRHEWLTFMMLAQEGWRDWLTPALTEADDYDLLRWCVASHHLKEASEINGEGAGPKVQLLQDHDDFKEALLLVAGRLKLHPPPKTRRVTLRANDVLCACREVHERWEHVDRETCCLLAAIKATLIAADVGASALPPRNVPLDWIGQRLSITPSRSDYEALVREKLDGQVMRPFQDEGGLSSARVTFVKAGCGSGKTLLAYHWAAHRQPVRRLYMCYPTTGTATEGFRGYLLDEDGRTKAGAKLFHSRAEVDLERILHVTRDDDDEDTKLASLDAWSTPIVAATVDTVLGLIQSQRRAVYAWPALAKSAFCFDEIHSYDNRMFGALLRFLRDLPSLPVLLMTASLPDPKLEAIRQVLARQDDKLREINGPADLEETARYCRLRADDVDAAVRLHLREGGKVLWVCNTVGRAMGVFDRLRDRDPMLYHSRYRYKDRVDRHTHVIAAFERSGAALVIATQVAEMSLDLSATLLVTDFAPIPALIQRLGRLNRRAKPDGKTTMPFIVVEPEGDSPSKWLPYNTKIEFYGDWPAATHAWLERLGDGPVSQKHLADAWDSSLDHQGDFHLHSTWLDDRTSRPDSVRGDLPGISVLLECDRTAAAADRRRFVESVIPMNQPKRKDWPSWPRVRGVPVAPVEAIAYDPFRGAAWVK
jgi:CRISPR-associated endonuclease/helicase Cas3